MLWESHDTFWYYAVSCTRQNYNYYNTWMQPVNNHDESNSTSNDHTAVSTILTFSSATI